MTAVLVRSVPLINTCSTLALPFALTFTLSTGAKGEDYVDCAAKSAAVASVSDRAANFCLALE